MPRPQVIDATALTIGYAGVYGTFFLFAKRAAEKYGVDSREILLELGRRGVIGGQEDMIIDVAAELAGKAGVTVGAGARPNRVERAELQTELLNGVTEEVQA